MESVDTSEPEGDENIPQDILETIDINAPLLTCSLLSKYVRSAFSSHFAYTSFEDDFFEPMALDVAEKFLDILDPVWVIFSKEERLKWAVTLAQQSRVSLELEMCRFLEEIRSPYEERGKAYSQYLKDSIHSSHDFSFGESLWLPWLSSTPYKHINASTKALKERVRKEAKLAALDKTLRFPYLSKREVRDFLLMQQKRIAYFFDNLRVTDIYVAYLKALTQSLDPHSTFYANFDVLPSRRASFSSYGGMYSLAQMFDYHYGYARLKESGQDISKSGLQVGDRITGIYKRHPVTQDWVLVSLKYLQAEEFLAILTSSSKEPLTLEVFRPLSKDAKSFEKLEVEMDRYLMLQYLSKQTLLQSSLAEVTGVDGTVRKVGVLRVDRFYDGSSDRDDVVSDSVSELFHLFMQGMETLVIDLRYNSGGSTKAALQFLYLFMNPEVAFQVSGVNKNQKNVLFPVKGKRKRFYQGDIPLVVLVSKASASASELIAQAVKVHGRGIVVGDSRTFGKGTLQKWVSGVFSDANQDVASLYLSVGRYYGTDGSSIQAKGVASDVVIPSLTEIYHGVEEDMEFALPHDEMEMDSMQVISPVVQGLEGMIATLQASSQKRVAKKDVFEEILALKHHDSPEEVSLKRSLSIKSHLHRLVALEHGKGFSESFHARLYSATFGDDSGSEDVVLKEATEIASEYLQLLLRQQHLERFIANTQVDDYQETIN